MERRSAAVCAVVGIDGSGKTSTYRLALRTLSNRWHVVGISDAVVRAAPGTARALVAGIPLARTLHVVGRLSRSTRWWPLYKNLKILELVARSRIRHHVEERLKPDLILTDGDPLVNSVAWSAARFLKRELQDDAAVLSAIRYMSGEEAVPVDELRSYLPGAWQLVVLNWSGVSRLRLPDSVILLRLGAAASMARIRARGKRLQAHENEAFLEELGRSYDRVCSLLATKRGLSVVCVPVERVSLDDAAAAVVDHIEARLVARRDVHPRAGL